MQFSSYSNSLFVNSAIWIFAVIIITIGWQISQKRNSKLKVKIGVKEFATALALAFLPFLYNFFLCVSELGMSEKQWSPLLAGYIFSVVVVNIVAWVVLKFSKADR